MSVVPQEPITLPASGERGRLSPRLDAVLLADAARERARHVRDALTMLVAVLGLPLWLVAGWPGRFSALLRVLAATGWAVAALTVLLAIAREHWWARVRSRRVEALGPLPRLRSERRGDVACAPPSEEEDWAPGGSAVPADAADRASARARLLEPRQQ